MILDSLKNKAQYAALHPRFQAVFDFIDNNDVASLPCGRHDIDGDNIFVMVQELDLREVSAARLELHRKYIDIQLLLSGPNEIFGWSEKKDCLTVETEFDEQKDIQLFTDIPQCFYSVGEGQFSILFPEDGHAPMLGEGHVKKCIFKVAL
jgi:YhcH/YjgK/YiaL family protein